MRLRKMNKKIHLLNLSRIDEFETLLHYNLSNFCTAMEN